MLGSSTRHFKVNPLTHRDARQGADGGAEQESAIADDLSGRLLDGSAIFSD